jgi:hypothetical protein
MYPTWDEKVQVWYFLYQIPFRELKLCTKADIRKFCLTLIERHTRNYDVDYESYITYTGHFGKAFLDDRITLPLKLPPEWKHISSMEPKLQVEYNPVNNIVAHCIKLTLLFNTLTRNGTYSLETRLREDMGVFLDCPDYMSLDKLKETYNLLESLRDLQDPMDRKEKEKKLSRKLRLKKEAEVMRRVGINLLRYCKDQQIFVPSA